MVELFVGEWRGFGGILFGGFGGQGTVVGDHGYVAGDALAH